MLHRSLRFAIAIAIAGALALGCATQASGEIDGGVGGGRDGSVEDQGGAPTFDIPADFQLGKEDTGNPRPPTDTGNPLPPVDTGSFEPPDTGSALPDDTGSPFPLDTGSTMVRDTGTPDTGIAPRDTGAPPRDAGTTPDGGPGCASSATCGTCTPMLSCGWCRTSRRCMTGTSTGPLPSSGTCSSTDWAWLRTACPATTDPCRTTTGCVSCRARSACGWCADSDTCHTGTSAGPTDGSCRSADWRWLPVLFCL